MRRYLKSTVLAICLVSSFLMISGCGHKDEDAVPAVPKAQPTADQSQFESDAAKGRAADMAKRMQGAQKPQGQ